MRKISKKTIKRIKAGYHDDLMEAIEFLIDTHNEDKFDQGYQSFLCDLPVHSERLAEFIQEESSHIGHKPRKGEEVWVISLNDLSRLINEYFTEALKQD